MVWSNRRFNSLSLEDIIPISDIDAVEIYRRPSEIPIEYSGTAQSSTGFSVCGVLVIWSKHR